MIEPNYEAENRKYAGTQFCFIKLTSGEFAVFRSYGTDRQHLTTLSTPQQLWDWLQENAETKTAQPRRPEINLLEINFDL